MASSTIPISSIAKNMTMNVKVTGLARFKIRAWIAIKLIRIAACIMGVGITVEGPEEKA
jgi:hypothetical protein